MWGSPHKKKNESGYARLAQAYSEDDYKQIILLTLQLQDIVNEERKHRRCQVKLVCTVVVLYMKLIKVSF